jgi:hypothetical protein
MLMLIASLQAAAAQTPPDIQIGVDASVRRVTIERRGEASLEVTGGEGSIVDVEAPAPNGRRTLRNVNVRVRAEARVADPRQIRTEPETPRPQ